MVATALLALLLIGLSSSPAKCSSALRNLSSRYQSLLLLLLVVLCCIPRLPLVSCSVHYSQATTSSSSSSSSLLREIDEEQPGKDGGGKVPCSLAEEDDDDALPGLSTGASSQQLIASFQQATHTPPKVAIFPPFLEWGEKPLFSPSSLTVTISNHCNTTLLTVFPAFSTSSSFYVAKQQAHPVVIKGGEEFHLRVVFLPRVTGMVQGVLVLQTSSGGFLVHVHGRGVPSPFKLQPFPRLNVAAGHLLREPVVIHNPCQGVMTVKEVRVWPASSDNRTLILNVNSKTAKCCSEEDADGEGEYEVSMVAGPSWEAGGDESLRVVELEFRAVSRKAWSWTGFVYMLVSAGGQDEQLVLPINVRVQENGDSSAFPVLQAVPEVIDFGLVSSSKVVKKQAVHLLNTGNEILKIEQVSHSLGSSTSTSTSTSSRQNLVAVRYRKGLVIHPGSQVQVAVAWYRGVEESVACLENKLDSVVFHTNSSSDESKLLQVPYRALVLHSGTGELDEEIAADRVNHAATGLQLQMSFFEKLERRLFPSSGLESVFLPCGELGMVDRNGEAEMVLQPSKQPLYLGSGLQFSAVQVGSTGSIWLSLTNPVETPITVKLFVAEEAEASDCKCFEISQAELDVFFLGEDAELLLGAAQTVVLGPLFFRPARRCAWTGLLAVKNNLTTVEWIPLQGSGSSAELSFVDDSLGLPLQSLELTAAGSVEPVSTVAAGVDENLSRLSEGLNSPACNRRMNGSLVARNTGDVPLKVHSVGLINGRCSWQGFELGESCQQNFWLAAGESTELKISYKPDYLSTRVKDELRLVTSIGTVTFPVLVVLPDHMLRLCASIPFYFRYRKMIVFVALVALLCMLLFLPGKVGGTKREADANCDSGSPTMSSGLPFFREEAFAPLVSEDSSGLSKIRVNVNNEASRGSSELKQQQQQQQHSIAVSSPVSSPRKSSKSQVDKTKRKRKKQGPLSSLKVLEKSSSSSPVSSTPASPATSTTSEGSQRPVSPCQGLPPSLKMKTSSRLDVETGPGTPSPSPPSSSSAAAGFSKLHARTQAAAVESDTSKHGGDWVTVDRKSALVDRSAAGEKKKAGNLTHSASFPSKSSTLTKVHQPQQICPSDRAPGSKITKNSSSSSLINELDSCSERSSSGRFCPGDVIVEERDCCTSPASAAAGDLVYDIWGDHFGDMSKISSSGEGTQSLFAYSVLKQQMQQQQQHQQQQQNQQQEQAGVEASEFSMFSGNEAAAFKRVVDQEELQQQQQQALSPTRFLFSPFDLSYRFPHTPV